MNEWTITPERHGRYSDRRIDIDVVLTLSLQDLPSFPPRRPPSIILNRDNLRRVTVYSKISYRPARRCTCTRTTAEKMNVAFGIQHFDNFMNFEM